MPTTKAVILARGLGTRMRKADDDASLDAAQAAAADSGIKGMIPIGRPFMDNASTHRLRVAAGGQRHGRRRACGGGIREARYVRRHQLRQLLSTGRIGRAAAARHTGVDRLRARGLGEHGQRRCRSREAIRRAVRSSGTTQRDVGSPIGVPRSAQTDMRGLVHRRLRRRALRSVA